MGDLASEQLTDAGDVTFSWGNITSGSSTSSFEGPRVSAKSLNLYHLNAQSIRNKLDCFESECIGYDVICVSETWLNNNIKNAAITIPSYQEPIRKDREDGYGGVCIYARDNLIVKPRPDLDIPGLEAVWAEVRNSHFKFLICALYRPPSSKVNYWTLIDESIQGAKMTNISNIFIMGDINEDQMQANSRFRRILERNHLVQLIDKSTHNKDNSSTLIDIIATNSTDYIKSSGIMPPSLSNHCPVYACLKISKQKCKTFKRKIIKTNNVNWNEVNNELENVDWSPVLTEPNIDKMITTWKKLYLSVIYKYVETKEVTIRPSDPAWMTPDLRRAIRKKNRLHKQAKKRNTTRKWEHFRKARNKVISMARQAKQDHKDRLAKKISDQQSADPRLWWKLVKEFYSNSASQKQLQKPLIADNKIVSEDYDKANALNDYFTSQCQLDTQGATLPDIETDDGHNLYMINITSSTVKDILEILDTSKSSGPDEVSAKFLKNTSKAIAPILSKIFNFSMHTAVFPDQWKLAYVTPLHKKNEEYLCQNYRPISLLPCLSKVFERCVFKDVYNYLIRTKKISTLQAAYSPGSSTEYQLLELYHIIAKSMEEGKAIRFIFCDVSKAFDKVWHEGVIHKLKKSGVRGKLLQWFESYLSNRRQCVIINGTKSDIKNISAGVPQGSILGPMLFLIYINDITEVVTSNVRLYADDSTLFVTTDTDEEAAECLNENLELISAWADKWFVTFNATKTVGMNFRRSQQDNQTPVYMRGTEIKSVDRHKHLGCTLQYNAKWAGHIEDITRKCSRRIDILRGLKYQLDRHTLEVLYKAYIKPIYEYACSVWCNCTKEQFEEIENLQLGALRVISGAIRGTSHQKIYTETNMTTTYDERERKNLTLFYKIYKGYAPPYLSNILPQHTRQISDYALRNREDLRTLRCNTKLLSNSFFPSYVKKWNSLDENVKSIGSIHDFKRELKKDDTKTPSYYYTGDRYAQTLHSRLRMNCSPLKNDLYEMHIIDTKTCECGHHTEDAEHYLLHCPLYTEARRDLLSLDPRINLDTHNILFGDNTQSISLNKLLFTKVSKYIRDTKRFS